MSWTAAKIDQFPSRAGRHASRAKRRFARGGLCVAACLGLSALAAQPVAARSDGITGLSTSGCNGCHSGGTTPVVSITGPATVTVNQTEVFTLTVVGGAGSVCGFDVSSDDGVLSATQAGTQLENGEVTHSAPRSFSGGSCSFDFSWTAPDIAGTATAFLFGAGNSANGNGTTSGDRGSTHNRAVDIVGGAAVSISADPPLIAPGDTSTIHWSATNAASCEAFGGWSGPRPTSGSEVVMPTDTTTYILECAGSIGSAVATGVTAVGFPLFEITRVAHDPTTEVPPRVSVGPSGRLFYSTALVSGFSGRIGRLHAIDLDGSAADLINATSSNLVEFMCDDCPIAPGPADEVYVLYVDQQSFSVDFRVYRLTAAGVLSDVSTTFAAQGVAITTGGRDMIVGPDGSLYLTVGGFALGSHDFDRAVLKVDPAGVATVLVDERDGFSLPHTIALESDGDLVIGDTFPDRVRRLTPTGLEDVLTEAGDGVVALDDLHEVVVDRDDNVYAASFATDSVFRVSPEGEIDIVLDASGDGHSTLDGPSSLATDRDGFLYVLGATSNNAFRVSPDGEAVLLIDSLGDGTTPLSRATEIAVDDAGNVYVSGTLSVFRIATRSTAVLGPEGDGVASLSQPRAIAADGQGSLHVAGFASDNVFRRGSSGAVELLLDATGPPAFASPSTIAVAASGLVYVDNQSDGGLLRISAPGVAENVAGASGVAHPGDFDAQGNFVFAVGANLLQAADTGGASVVATIDAGLAGSGLGEVALDGTGVRYVSVPSDDRVLRVTPAGVASVALGPAGDGVSPLTGVAGIDVSDDGVLFAVGRTSRNVFRVMPDGSTEELLDESGDGFHDLVEPVDVAFDPTRGDVYVVDRQPLSGPGEPASFGGQVFVLRADGSRGRVLAASGDGLTAFGQPERIAVGAAGPVYVTAVDSDSVFAIERVPEAGPALGLATALGVLVLLRLVGFRQRRA